MFDHWGFGRLGALERKASIDEMRPPDWAASTLVFLLLKPDRVPLPAPNNSVLGFDGILTPIRRGTIGDGR